MTVRDNILLGANYSDDEIYSVLEKVKLLELINKLPNKLDTEISLDGNNLSGGEKQRVVLARALIRKTPIIILDEATSAIDVDTAIQIEHSLMNEDDRTVIMISHHLHPSIKDQLDEVVLLG